MIVTKNTGDAAHEYVDLGLSVFPIAYRGKSPLLPKWEPFQTRLPSDAELSAWSENYKEFNLALACGAQSGVVVLDADGPEAVRFCEENGLISPIRVKTGRGYHYYFRHPGSEVRNRGKMWGRKDIQIRADGGYVIIPPSVHASGHMYEWVIATGAEWEDMPVWDGRRHLRPVDEIEEFTDIDLTDVEVQGRPVWDEAIEHVEDNGPYREGDGRNNILTKYVGEKISDGVNDTQLDNLIEEFQGVFFEENLPISEVGAMIRSLREIDMRNHADKYTPDGDRLSDQEVSTLKPEDDVKRPDLVPGIFTVDEILSTEAAPQNWLIEPWLETESIVQVFGYYSHGKSLLTAAMMWHLAAGRDFGPFHIPHARKVLYLDLDMGQKQIRSRAEDLCNAWGSPGGNLTFWIQALAGEFSIDPRSQQGMVNLEALLNQERPEVIVIDNVRNLMPNMPENDATAWSLINELSKRIRNNGTSVVLLHHSNKPQRTDRGEMLEGGEAGSGNQLTVLETQMRVTKLDEDNSDYLELQRQLRPGEYIRHAMTTTYGKLRNRDPEIHKQEFFAFAVNGDHNIRVISSTSNRQKAHIMHGNGMSLPEIGTHLKVTQATLREWLNIT